MTATHQPCGIDSWKARKLLLRCRGAAVVELAITLPMVVLLLLGAIEIGRAVSVQHTLTEAARAACRVYCVSDNTPEQARAMVDAALADSGFEGYSVTLYPATSEEIDTQLEPVTVTVSINYENVSWMSPWFMSGKSVTGSAIMPADTGTYAKSDSSSGIGGGGSSGGGGDDDEDDDEDEG